MLLRPLSRAARAWLQEHVHAEPWQWFGGALAVEPRYVGAIVEAMMLETTP